MAADQEPKLVIYIGLNYERAVFEVFEYDINLPLVLDEKSTMANHLETTPFGFYIRKERGGEASSN